MKRATVDTNIFISALFWKGTPDRVIEVFKRGEALLLLSNDILAELERKLSSAKFASRIAQIGQTPAELVAIFRDMAEPVVPVDLPEDAVADPKDLIILACAVAGDANYIVSGDHHLLDLKAYREIVVVTPAQFLAILNPPPDDPSKE
jgi:putative PIN family toxin of toxin-antitoxin system